jgi:glutathione S-transferase
MSERITIHGFGDVDRSGKLRWLANELGLEIDEQRVEFGAQRQKPYIDLNPFALIPTAIFRGRTLIESTAACHTIAESFETPKLWVGRGEPEREKYLFWLGLFGENFEGRLVECAVSKAGILGPEYFEIHERRIRPKLEVAAKMLPREGFVAGDRFTIADVVTGYGLRLAVRLGLVPRGAIEPYFSRLVQRPAAKAARFFASLG